MHLLDESISCSFNWFLMMCSTCGHFLGSIFLENKATNTHGSQSIRSHAKVMPTDLINAAFSYKLSTVEHRVLDNMHVLSPARP